jgi:hypothetical protein
MARLKSEHVTFWTDIPTRSCLVNWFWQLEYSPMWPSRSSQTHVMWTLQCKLLSISCLLPLFPNERCVSGIMRVEYFPPNNALEPVESHPTFRGTCYLHLQGRRISQAKNKRETETSVDFQRTTRRYIPEDGTLLNHRCENLKSCSSWTNRRISMEVPMDVMPLEASFLTSYHRRWIFVWQ